MIWYFVLLLLTSSALAAEPSLVLVDAPLLMVDQNGNASATILLRNDTGTPIPQLRLNLSDFMHKRPDGKSYPLGTSRTLAVVNEGEKPIFDGKNALPADATLSVLVTVTKLWEAGQSEAILKNGDTLIPVLGGPSQSSLKALRIPAAYNVQIISSTPDTPEIHFVGDRALVGLKNADPFTYRFAWRLYLNGQLFDGGSNFIDLPPGASKYVSLARPGPNTKFPEPTWLIAGTLKDEIVKGDLVLEPVFEGDAMTQPLPPKNLPVTFRLSYWSDNWQQFWNIYWIFLLLAVGGVFSIWVHAGMPNTARALALRRRLDDLATRIRGLGASVDSRWRVLLESHLQPIRRELYSTFWSFPSFATTLDRVTERVDMVQKWVEVAYSASIVLHLADQHMHLIPHTVLRWLQERCIHALTPIASGLTTDEEIVAMKADIKAAENYLTITVARAQNADLTKEITDRENQLKQGSPPALDELPCKYPEYTNFINQVKAAISANTPLSPVNYSDRDVCSLKVDLLWTFHQRWQKTWDGEARKRLEQYRPKLMEYLVADTHESLNVAGLRVDEMRQDIYPESLVAAVTQMEIRTDPRTVYAQSPIRLALCFKRQLLNEAVARQEWTCTWDFGDQTPCEEGWEVFHSYESPGKPQVQITIRNLDGELVVPGPPPSAIEVHYSPERSGPAPGLQPEPEKPVAPVPPPGTIEVHDSPERSGPTPGLPSKPETWPEYVRRVRASVWRFVKLEPETRLELVRLMIVLALALLGLMTTARQQVQNLTFLEAVGVVVTLGFGADTIKNLIVQRSSSS
jgi:hypothetical protein